MQIRCAKIDYTSVLRGIVFFLNCFHFLWIHIESLAMLNTFFYSNLPFIVCLDICIIRWFIYCFFSLRFRKNISSKRKTIFVSFIVKIGQKWLIQSSSIVLCHWSLFDCYLSFIPTAINPFFILYSLYVFETMLSLVDSLLLNVIQTKSYYIHIFNP